MLFLVGVAMTISASFLTTLGILIQKKSYSEPPEKMLKIWLGGFAMMAFAAFLELAAFGLASQSVLAPLSACNLVCNIILSPCVIGDKASNGDMFATGIVILGCFLAIAFGDQTVVEHTIDDMIAYAAQAVVIVFFIFLALTTTTAVGGVIYLEAPYREAKRKANPMLWTEMDVQEWLVKIHKEKAAPVMERLEITGPVLLKATYQTLEHWGIDADDHQGLWQEVSLLNEIMREIEAREKQEEEEHGVTKLERAMNFLTPLDSINMGLKPLAIGTLYSAHGGVHEALSPRSRKTFWEISSALWNIMDDPNGEPGADGAGSPSSPLSDGETGFKEDDPLGSITVKLHMLHAVCYSYTGGATAACAVIFAKCGVESLKGGIGQCLGSGFFWLVFILGSMSIYWQMRFLNWALQYHAALLVVPIFLCCKILLSISGGGLYFKEFDNFSGFQLIMFGVGVSVTVFGIVLLTMLRARTNSQERAEKAKEEQEAADKKAADVEAGISPGAGSPSVSPGLQSRTKVEATPRSSKILSQEGILSPSRKLSREMNPIGEDTLSLEDVIMSPTNRGFSLSMQPGAGITPEEGARPKRLTALMQDGLDNWQHSPMSRTSTPPSTNSSNTDSPARRRRSMQEQAPYSDDPRTLESRRGSLPTFDRPKDVGQRRPSQASLSPLPLDSDQPRPPSVRTMSKTRGNLLKEAEKERDARSERAARLANQTSADPSPRVSKSRDPSPRPSVATGKTPPLKLGDKIAQKASPTTPKPLAGAPKLSKIGNLIRAAGEKSKTPGAKPDEEKVASPPDLLSPPSRSIPQGKEREFNLDM